MTKSQDVLDFWFSEDTKRRWFKSTPEFDAEIRQRFEVTAKAVARSPFPLQPWESDPDTTLALIILLDQFPRNMFRNTQKAFSWDPLALEVAERMVTNGWDQKVVEDRRAFVYMPFMHAEDLSAQERCVALTASLEDTSTHRHAKAHRDVIARFGRFPHRNSVLGRESTQEEGEFLANGGYDPS